MLNLPEFLTELNEKQLEAARYITGPLLILAGAGTGKTKVIVSKIAYIIDAALVAPDELLAVTFTNKAAFEMNERITNHVNFKLPWVGTFHSMAVKILRQNANIVGLDENFIIIDRDDQLKLIKNICENKNIDKSEANPKLLLNIIQQWKDLAIEPEGITNSDIHSPLHELAKKIYKDYQFQLKKIDSVDFGDIILSNLNLFKQAPHILEKYQNRFKFIFVDEYQDTNTAQYLWLRMISQGNNNICCVGDDDQSIYGWRGAQIGNILRFEHDFPNAKVIKLEQNYRSNKDILAAAASIISHNKSRYGKSLWTNSQTSHKITLKSCWNDREEAEYIANQIYKLTPLKDIPYKNIAILVRATFQTRIIEEVFTSHSVPYKIIGGLKFYDRQEIRDALAYLKLLSKYNDDLSLERVINKPKRGIGRTTLNKIKEFSHQQHISMFQAIEFMTKEGIFSSKIKNELLQFINMIKTWTMKHQQLSLAETLEMVMNESGYLQMLKDEKTSESQSRIENLAEFKQALTEYSNLTEFLEHVALVTENDEFNSDNLVNIMTLHAAKGLEFDAVFLPGWEEGLFPHAKTIEENGNKGLEEERRLAYVGITRAKKMLFITYSSIRRMYNQYIDSLPSRFIKEIPEDCLLKIGIENKKVYNYNLNTIKQNNTPKTSNKVSHLKFGIGFVINHHGDLLEINFEKFGTKKILKKFIEFIN